MCKRLLLSEAISKVSLKRRRSRDRGMVLQVKNCVKGGIQGVKGYGSSYQLRASSATVIAGYNCLLAYPANQKWPALSSNSPSYTPDSFSALLLPLLTSSTGRVISGLV